MGKKILPGVNTFRTEATQFENGRERPLEITLYPKYIEIRTVGVQQSRYHVPYGTISRVGAEMEVKHRISRGRV